MHHLSRLFSSALVVVLVQLVFFTSMTFADEHVHIVQPGDTLSEIAQQYSTDVETLRRLNDLGDIDFVWSGQRLVLPTEAAAAVENPADSRVDRGETVVYVVQPGDTLLGIAATHGISLAWLAERNQIYPGQRLVAGREILVPAQPDGQAQAGADEGQGDLRIHVVQAGESIGSIANHYYTTPAAIIRANELANPNVIVPGQRLQIAPPSLAERMGMAPEVGVDGYHVHTEFPTTTEKWIDVDLSEQRVVAYEGANPVKAFIISSGLPGTPTVTGTFRIWAKTPLQDMYGGNRASGTYYYLRDVPWVQYFYEDYAFHGTTWHANFGRPASRGCINMRTEDARWLYEWASPTHTEQGWFISDEENPGTLVVVHR